MGILLSKGLSTQLTDELGNITTSEGKSIFIKNTNIELPEVYVRVSFDCGYDGKTMSIKFQTSLHSIGKACPTSPEELSTAS